MITNLTSICDEFFKISEKFTKIIYNVNKGFGWEAEMKYLCMFIIVLVVYLFPIHASILKITESETVLFTNSASPKLHSTIKNTTDKTQTFIIKRTIAQVPEHWDTYFCFTACFPPFMDEAEVSLEGGATDILQVDFTIDTEKVTSGKAVVQYTLTSIEDPNEVHVRTYACHYGPEKVESKFSFNTEKAEVVSPLDKGGEHTFSLQNKSDSDEDITISWERLAMKEEWDLSVCLDVCFPPFVTSADVTLPANVTKEMLIHVTPSDSGTGIVQYNVGPKGEKPTASIVFTYPTVGVESILTAGVAPKKELAFHRIGDRCSLIAPGEGDTQIDLFTSRGQRLMTLFKGSVSSNQQLQFAMPTIASGLYFITLNNGLSHYSIPLAIH